MKVRVGYSSIKPPPSAMNAMQIKTCMSATETVLFVMAQTSIWIMKTAHCVMAKINILLMEVVKLATATMSIWIMGAAYYAMAKTSTLIMEAV